MSLLSPHIRHRLLSEAEVLQAVLRRHGATDAVRFIEEVFWRAYFKGWLEQHPTVWTDYRATVGGLIETLETNAGLRERYEAAVSGNTGIECFDAWVSELVAWSRSHDLAAVVTAYAPVGPVAERLARVRRALAGHGVELLQLRRRFDSVTWPYATRGYFRLKSRIPGLLDELGLVGPEKQSRSAIG